MNITGKVLVTGASGFIGSAIARQLVARGFSVRALVRPTSPRAHLDGLALDLTEGDFRDRRSIRRAMAGIRSVFHVAADYRLWARDRNEIYQNNVIGTRIIMEEALKARVERIVYTSSVATIALQAGCEPADETVPLEEEKAIGAYKNLIGWVSA